VVNVNVVLYETTFKYSFGKNYMVKKMVSIVIPRNSLVDIINAGLASRYYEKKGTKTTVHLIDSDKTEQFWSNIRDYVDKDDRTLLILNLPVPSEEKLKRIDLKPFEFSILNVPSESVIVTDQHRKALIEKGIVSMPQRPAYKCFPGEYTGSVEKRWMAIGQKVSLEEKLAVINEKTASLIRGLLKTAGEAPDLAIQKVKEDNVAFFTEVGSEWSPTITREIIKPDVEVVFTSYKGFDLIRTAFHHFLQNRKAPLWVEGNKESVILTLAPTFAQHMLRECEIEGKNEMKFGMGSAIITRSLDDISLGLCLGRLTQKIIPIEYGKPKFVIEKTLRRRLVGGKGPAGRSYHGIKEKYPELEIEGSIINTPQAAFEEVITVLAEAGASFKIKA
jgi:hypothetical protein